MALDIEEKKEELYSVNRLKNELRKEQELKIEMGDSYVEDEVDCYILFLSKRVNRRMSV